MRIREYESGDLAALRRMHAEQGFGYPFPDLDNPLFLTKLVLEDDDAAEPGREAGDRNSPPESSQAVVADGLARSNSPRPGVPRIAMAVLLRLTAETYLLHDPAEGTPQLRWQRFLALHEATQRDARARGLADVQAFLPPSVARAFGRRLTRLGWMRDPWPCFTRLTSPE